MRTEIKKVYYCDFCKKKGMSSYHLQKHEIGCTANPQRVCHWCYNSLPEILKEAVTYIRRRHKDGWWPEGQVDEENIRKIVNAVEEKMESCPVCTLAAIRQSDRGWIIGVYDYKGAIKNWRMEEANEQRELIGPVYYE